MKFKEWLNQRDESFGKFLMPIALAGGMALGGSGAAQQSASPDLVKHTTLTQQDVSKKAKFHPYSYRSVPNKDRMEKTPDYRSAYQNYLRYGTSGLDGQAEQIFQQMLKRNEFN